MASEGDAFESLEGEVDYPMYVVTAAWGINRVIRAVE
jgi:hypothetical protein